MKEFSFEIHEAIATLSDSGKGYTKELNLISYNGGKPVYDIRQWYTDESEDKKMLKGCTLTKEEIIKLRDELNELDL